MPGDEQANEQVSRQQAKHARVDACLQGAMTEDVVESEEVERQNENVFSQENY